LALFASTYIVYCLFFSRICSSHVDTIAIEDYITKDKRPQKFFHARAITPIWNDRWQLKGLGVVALLSKVSRMVFLLWIR